MTGKCSECEWWSKYSNRKNGGVCRKNPPYPSFGVGGGGWPVTDGDDWCGKFKRWVTDGGARRPKPAAKE